MPANPWDYSAILLSNQSGAALGAGLADALRAVSRGVIDYRQKKKEEEADAAFDNLMGTPGFAEKHGIPINAADKDEIKAMRKAAGGGQQAFALLSKFAAQREQQETARLQRAAAQAQLEEHKWLAGQRDKNAVALAAAMGSPAPLEGTSGLAHSLIQMGGLRPPRPSSGDLLRDYVAAGGEITPGVVDLAKLYMPGKPMPGSAGTAVEDIPGVGRMVRDAATGEPIDSGKIIKPSPAPGAGGYATEDVAGVGKVVRDLGTGELLEPGKIIKPSTRDAADVTFESNLKVAMQKLDEFEATVKKYGNFETAQFGNPEAKSRLDQLPYQLAILTAKIVDPSSVAREGEVAAAQKYLIPAGFFKTNATTLAAIKNMRETFRQYQAARDDAKDAAAPPPAAGRAPADPSAAAQVPEFQHPQQVEEAVAAGAIAKGALVRIGGKVFRVE